MGEQIILSLTIYGLAIVISLVVAVMIQAIVVALPHLQRRGGKSEVATAQRDQKPNDGIPAEHVAAIAAAVAALGKSHHILHIEDRHSGHDWAAEGRMIHQTSHNVPHGSRR